MRISLIHGEDIKKAYNHYQEQINSSKKKGFEIIPITGVHQIVSQSLFEDKIIFNLDKPKKVSANEWIWLGKNSPKYNSNLLIYYEGNAPVVITKNLPKDSKKEKFELPKIIFQFLDSFYPDNFENCLKLLDNVAKNEPIELVFHLLSLRMRELYWLKISKETLNLPSWRKTKLSSQAEKYSIENIQNMIKNLAGIDIKSKTGDNNLKNMLDILIVKYLQ